MYAMTGLGRAVVVPIINPGSAAPLVRLAARLADPDGTLVPVTVIPPEASRLAARTAEELLIRAEGDAAEQGVRARGVLCRGAAADEVLGIAAERQATLVVMGWQGRSTQRNVFGEIIDSIVGRSSTPLAVARLQEHPFERILLAVGADHLAPSGSGGVTLAAEYVRRLSSHGDLPVRVLRSGADDRPVPQAFASLSDRVHHDPRRHDLAVGAAARPDDLIVVPVASTTRGLREATTHVAWAAPDASLLIAMDMGPAPDPGLAEAARDAGAPPAAVVPPGAATGGHRVIVTVRTAEEPAQRPLAAALDGVGLVGDEQRWHDAAEWCVQSEVIVLAGSSNEALAAVMTALHGAPGFHGAEIRYDLADDGES